MAKKTFPKDAEGRAAIRVTELVPVGVTRFLPGRVYHVDEATLAALGTKAVPADG